MPESARTVVSLLIPNKIHHRSRCFHYLNPTPLHSQLQLDDREFLDKIVVNDELHARESIAMLGSMITINAAIMLNQEGKTVEETVEYMMEYGFRERAKAQSVMNFIGPTSENGKPNLWAPYTFTYLFGRIDFVLPAFTKAVKEDVLGEFFRTIYLNPYSGSSVTWKKAFEWL